MSTQILKELQKRSNRNKVEFSDVNAYFEAVRNHYDVDKEDAIKRALEIRTICAKRMQGASPLMKKKYFEVYRKTLLFCARDDFDSYLQYVEINRAPEKRFYLPRRKVLRGLVQDYQDLTDGKIRFLGISLPPRVGKSTLGIFYITWLMGRDPERANVMSGHSDKLTRGFYDEAMSILTNPEYLFFDVFPGYEIISSSKDESIDLGRKRRFSSLTCRAVGATLTGAVEAGYCLYCDDLVEDLEEALNPVRMQNKFDAYLNQLKDRMTNKAFQVMVGTRWSVDDPLGRLKEMYADDPTYRFTVIPALNEHGESNFQYDHGVGFSTEYYLDMKKSIDDATWCAKYMGDPYIREGLLFEEESLNYYNGEIDMSKADRVVSVADVAWGGGDYYVQIFAYELSGSYYIHDVITTKADKSITQPMAMGKMKYHRPSVTQFEANNGGHEYADHIDTKLKADGYRLNISSRNAGKKKKEYRIIEMAPEIREFYFKERSLWDDDYRAFMSMVTRFTSSGKNQNDDAPDALAMLAEMVAKGRGRIEVIPRFM